jgi:hypothetical protein
MPPRDPPSAHRTAEVSPPFARRERSCFDAHAHWRATGEVPSAEVPKLGELLLARGHVTPAELAQALSHQRSSGLPLGSELLARGHVEASHVHDALWLQRCIAAAALLSAVALEPLDAQAGGAQLGVGATVPLVAAMKMLYQVPTIEIGEADVARGFVEVRSATRFSVATTSSAGYAVELVSKLPIFVAVDVVSPLGTARLGPEGGVLIARGRPRRDASAELSYRFELAPSVRAGTYPFPLHLAVRPL